jgi:hypothetical protein
MLKYLVALVVAVALAVTGCAPEDDTPPTSTAGDSDSGVDTNSGNTDNPPQDDVTITTCGANALDLIEVSGTIVNHSSKSSNYLIEVDVVAADGTVYGQGFAAVNALDGGARAEWQAITAAEQRDGATCRLRSVDRFAS